MYTNETIFALSSAPGRAGVAVLRLSGPEAGAALERLAGARPPPRRARLARVVDPRSGDPIDRGLALWFPAPASFTGEDMAELHVHGGRAVVAAAVAALAALPGLRPAEAGEFTRRAFDNGKLDLSEVEGLADLIAAETEAQRRQALRQMEGGLSRQAEDWRTRLVQALAHAEAAIDFPDEDLPDDLAARVVPKILGLRDEILHYVGDDRRGERLRDGVYIAIIGPPNAGKSSLLNAVARRDVAIVSETAGTTRDVIEVHLDLGGYPVTLADTAGLRPVDSAVDDPGVGDSGAAGAGQAAVEREGMRRARAGAAAADLRIAVLDVRAAQGPAPELADLLTEDALIVLNKIDLAPQATGAAIAGSAPIVVSAKTGAGLGALLDRLEAEVAARLDEGGAAPITRARHRRALEDAAEALARAAAAKAPELLAEDLRLAARALGRIAGRVDVDDVLDVIFRDFCIGK